MTGELQIAPAELLGLASAVANAHRAGLIHALAMGPASAPDLAVRLGLAERPLRLLLELLVAFDLAQRDGARYAAAPVLRDLQRDIPGGLLTDARLWAHLPGWLADDRPLSGIDGGPTEREHCYAEVVAGLGQMWTSAARVLASRLSVAGQRVLDVGCGSGVWGLALAEHDPRVHVTGLDFPAVLTAFADRARALGLVQRTATLAGDAHRLAVPAEQYDLVMFANVLRLEPPDGARALLRRWAAAIEPGGSMVIVDALASGSAAADRARALYAVHLALRSARATVHEPRAIEGYLAEAGLENFQTIELGEVADRGALGVIVARRPA
jgi:ubiquinone/menaquinone biosynthesis C-methylase UbiE